MCQPFQGKRSSKSIRKGTNMGWWSHVWEIKLILKLFLWAWSFLLQPIPGFQNCCGSHIWSGFTFKEKTIKKYYQAVRLTLVWIHQHQKTCKAVYQEYHWYPQYETWQALSVHLLLSWSEKRNSTDMNIQLQIEL